MSRYLILLLLNLPFISISILSAITQYKLGRSSKRRAVIQILAWAVILVGLVSAEYIYNWLFSNNLTQTESLSLFDVLQITAIVFLLYFANRLRTKVDYVENRLRDIHQEISIRLSTEKKKP